MAQMRSIDSVKFLDELEKRNLNKTAVSEDLGFGKKYITDALRRGRISNNAVRMLEAFYAIKPDSYCVEDNVNYIEIMTDEKESVIDYDKLRETIYDAVYWAVKKAWAE